MIRRNTAIAVVVFVGLAAAALLLGKRSDDSGAQTPTPAPEPIWSLQSSEIVGLIVEDLRAGQVIELARDEEELWQIVRPRAMPADPARVERAVSWLAAPRPRAEIFDVLDLAAFELDEPHYRIELLTAGGERLVFSVGRQAPTGGSRYAIYNQRPGVLVFSSLGLDEVLQLAPDLIPTPTPAPTDTPAPSPDSSQEPEG